MSRSALLCSLLLLLSGSGPSWAACTAYVDPVTMSASSFLQTGFGALAIPKPGVRNRMLVFENSDCYDLAYLNLKSLNFQLNNKETDERSSFFAGNTIKIYDYEMGGEPQFQIKFRRNANADESADKWVRADHEDKLQEGGRFNGAFGIVLNREFDPEDKLSFATLDEFLGVTKLSAESGLLAEWHAVIVPVTDSSGLLFPNKSYTVLQNTRLGIEPLGMDGIDLSAAPKSTVIGQLHLIKFARLASPNTPIQALDIKVSGASCFYLRYRIDGENDAFLKQGNIPSDYLVLRLKDEASC